MKKMILLTFTVFVLNISVAQTYTASPNTGENNVQAPGAVTNKFNSDNPNSKPSWSRDGSNYRADYIDAGTYIRRSVIYDKDGNVIGREEVIARGNYPTAISDYYLQNYPNEDYEIWQSTDGVGNKTYYSVRSAEVIWFDKDGKYKDRKPRTLDSPQLRSKK